MEVRYFVDGIEVTRGDAVRRWRASRTYRMARFKDAILPNAERGSNSQGEFNHLREAGIVLKFVEQEKPNEH